LIDSKVKNIAAKYNITNNAKEEFDL